MKHLAKIGNNFLSLTKIKAWQGFEYVSESYWMNELLRYEIYLVM